MDVQPPQGVSQPGSAARWIASVAAALFVATIGLLSLRSISSPSAPAPRSESVATTAQPMDREALRLEAARAIARTLAPLPSRRLPERSKRDEELFRLATALKAPGSAVENPCTEWAGPFCVRTSLEPFFSALDNLRSGRTTSRTTIAAFGNSLIAADRIVDIVREDLVSMFGDGGRGLLLVDRIADYGDRVRTGVSADGWLVNTVGDVKRSTWPFGLAGVVHISDTPRARSRFRIQGETQGTLFWVDKGAGPIELRVDGKPLLTTTPQGDGHSQRTDFTLPADTESLELIAHKKGTAVHGVALDRPGPGLVLDTLGVPAADASLFLQADEAMVSQQLAARAPALVLIMLGGNEVKRLQWRRSTLEKVERDLHHFIQRIKRASLASACLVVGPLDAVLGPDAARPFQQRADLQEVIELERKIALAEGCAFFDMFAAMGGTGSLERFHARGLVHDDLVHPRGKGLDLIGALLSNALLTAWSETPHAEQPYALTEAWATLVGGDLLPHEVSPWRQPPRVVLLPGSPDDPVMGGIQRLLAAARASTPRSGEVAWVVIDPVVSEVLPEPPVRTGPVMVRCASLIPAKVTVRAKATCLPVTIPALPPDLQDPVDQGVAMGAWLLAEIVRNDSLAPAGRVH